MALLRSSPAEADRARLWPTLTGAEVHLWRAATSSLDPRLDGALSADEWARAGRLRVRRDGLRFGRGRGFLRAVLGRYLERDPKELRLEYGWRGKPELSDGRLRFNLSHSDGLLLLAVTLDRPIGVDLERVRPVADLERIAARFFSEAENLALASVPARDRPELFFRCWSRKEAYLKARGCGLGVPLAQVDVGLAAAEGPAPLVMHGSPEESTRWSLSGLRPAPEHCAALVVEVPAGPLRQWEWSDFQRGA